MMLYFRGQLAVAARSIIELQLDKAAFHREEFSSFDWRDRGSRRTPRRMDWLPNTLILVLFT